MAEIVRKVSLLEGVEAKIEDSKLIITGPKGSIERTFEHPHASIQLSGNEITITVKSKKRKDLAIANTWVAHVKNMIYGVIKGFKGKMEIVHVHFPMNVKKEDGAIIITNFMGEKGIRRAKIVGNVEVEVSKDSIIVRGANIEEVSQTMANIEQICKKRGGRDPRIFYDGIYIVNKPKRSEELWSSNKA